MRGSTHSTLRASSVCQGWAGIPRSEQYWPGGQLSTTLLRWHLWAPPPC